MLVITYNENTDNKQIDTFDELTLSCKTSIKYANIETQVKYAVIFIQKLSKRTQ